MTGVETGDVKSAVKSAALEGSKGFMWGAIGGAVSGGAGEEADFLYQIKIKY